MASSPLSAIIRSPALEAPPAPPPLAPRITEAQAAVAPAGPASPASQRQPQAPAGTESGTQPMPAAAVQPAPPSTPQPAPPSAPQPAPPSAAPRRGPRIGLILLLVALPLVCGAAAAWMLRDEILNLGGPGAGDHAPTHHPGKAR
jgi:hypothetical protein